MPVVPGGCFNRLVKEERGLDFGRPEDGTDQGNGGRRRVFLIHDQVDPSVPLLEFAGEEPDPFARFRQVVVPDVVVAEGGQVNQEGIAAGQARPGLGQIAVLIGKIMVKLAKGENIVLRPFIAGTDARQGYQLLIGTRVGEKQVVQAGFLGEGAVFIVGDDARIVALRRIDPRDVRLDIVGAQVF